MIIDIIAADAQTVALALEALVDVPHPISLFLSVMNVTVTNWHLDVNRKSYAPRAKQCLAFHHDITISIIVVVARADGDGVPPHAR